MSKRCWVETLVCGFLCMFLVFLSMGSASAACVGNPCVVEPGDTVKVVRSGSTQNIGVSISTDPFAFPVWKYKLYYRCLGPDFTSWRLITTRKCNPYVGCPSIYPWSTVPYLPPLEVLGDLKGNEDQICDAGEDCAPERTCAIRVAALDNAGRAAIGMSGKFLILPPNVAPSFLYIRPAYRSNLAGGSATYQVFGRAPYAVLVEETHRAYIKIDGSSAYQEMVGDGIGDDDGFCESSEDCYIGVVDATPDDPRVFTVSNTYACGTSQEVTITVMDSSGETASALYVIACSP